MKLLLQSGSALAKLIRQREVSSREVVEAHINHAMKINPKINAIVKDRFEAARKEANQADALLQKMEADKLPAFHGVPGTIKECFAFAGMPQTVGLVSRKNFIASKDATTVKRYRSAGIIPIGVTNVPELCMWPESYNHVYGRTNNPYNLKCTVGGSSGGEGAIIGSGASPLGLGSDIAGSLRFPAFFNGIFSHKSSNGLVPNTGTLPAFVKKVESYQCVGPMARRAEDLFPLLKILKGPDGEDPLCVEIPLADPATVDLAKLTVISVESNGIANPSPDLIDAQRKAVAHLSSLGAKCKTVNFDKLKKSYEIFTHSFLNDGGFDLSSKMGNGKKINVYVEMLKSVFGASDHIFPILFGAAQEDFIKKRIKPKYVEMGLALKQEIYEALGDNGVLLFPTYTRPAPKHNKILYLINHWTYCAILNVCKMPVSQVPLGLNSERLPLGVQVATTPGKDHLSLAVALNLEKAFGGWVPPAAIDS